jgi:hypothetical protein
MSKGFTRVCLCICMCLVGLMALGLQPALAQTAAEKPAVYTYVSEWTVPRAMWADYDKQQAAGIDAMKKLVADGTLVGFGNFAVVNHQEGAPTHGSWFSASSMANLMKVLEGLRAAPAATSPVFAASKHWDFLLSSRDYNAHSGTFTNGYLRVATWTEKPDASDPGGKLMKATIGALLEKMLMDGSLHAYTIDRETVHSMDPNTFFIVMVTNGAEGLDKFNAALEEMGKSNPAALPAFGSLIEGHGHRDTLARVGTATYK